MSILQEFKEFAIKGNMIDLAVGVIIGGAFSKITDSLVKDVFMPFISWIIGGDVDFSQWFIVLGDNPNNLTSLADLKAAGVNVLSYGSFLTILINFLLLAWIVFLMVKGINRLRRMHAREEEKPKKADEKPVPEPEDIKLLREIRDQLKTKNS
ncbi:large-conductance mechanosensitive channel protein [Alkanindiges hydrocarboniclasticus]|uniref:Large-conductance mechanosensitive channel n=1 Tax=Alkanindiges hydrocarboniclasticus TaxID=1907941 RepID=A0A1S8CTA2_9GAMM|nr:large conductance mechanosensitive channel protein MscL [Alkanindiges hydrocarboniclasticus]ONG39238.1 large-conductance mechanosensitive channel protein [Alkanindiges hydrocarboniclasticus]